MGQIRTFVNAGDEHQFMHSMEDKHKRNRNKSKQMQ